MEHGRAAPGRVEADLLLRLEHGDRGVAESAAAADSPAIPPPMTRMSALFTSAQAAVSRSFTTLPPWVRRMPLTISSSSGSTGRPCSLSQKADEEIVEVAREQRRGVGGEAAREVGRADDRHAMLLDGLAGDRSLDIAARLGRQVDDHAARPHRRQLGVADQPRRRPAGDQRGGDHDVLLGDVARTPARPAPSDIPPTFPSRSRRRPRLRSRRHARRRSAWRRATGSAPWSPSGRRSR